MANKYAQAAADWTDVAGDATWFDADVGGSAVDGPVTGDTVFPNGNTVTIDEDIDLADYTKGGAGTINIGAGVTVTSVPAAWTIANNGGTITTNNGTVTTNGAAGIITTNNLTVTTNNGTITTNSSTGTVGTNNLTITTNNGTVTTNSATGTIALWNVSTAVTGCSNAGTITELKLITSTASVVYVATDLAPLKVSLLATNISAGNIKDTVAILGVTGTYPTTATTQAADAATLDAQKAYLLETQTVTFGASSVTGTLAANKVLDTVSGGTLPAAGVSALVTGGTLAASKIHDGTYGTLADGSVLLAAGGSYVPPVVGQVLAPANGGTAYGPSSGTNGTYVPADSTYVLSTAPDYGIAGTGGAKTATLPGAGFVLTSSWGGPATFGVAGTGTTPTATLTLGANVIETASAFGAAGTSITPSLTTASALAAVLDARGIPSGATIAADITALKSITATGGGEAFDG